MNKADPAKRTKGAHLSKPDKEALRREIIAGVHVDLLAERYNISVRNVHAHKAKIEGRYSEAKTSTKDGPPKHLRTLCRHSDCQETGEGNPPYCPAHRPETSAVKYSSVISPIPLKRLMGGRA